VSSGTGRMSSLAWTLSARANQFPRTVGVALSLLDMLRTESERTLAALRHRLGRNAFRFLCETHLELPAQPPPGCRTLVLFAHFDVQGIVDPYVAYYLKALHELGATIVFVSGSPTLTPESVAPIRSFCAGIYTRRTLSLDFGSWHLAWCILRHRGWSLDQFDRFVIANDSVFGPLFPLEELWRSFHDADMYGAIENTQMIPHLQSFFLAWDLNSRTRPFLDDFWSEFQYVVHKATLIWRYEIGLSRRARKAGLSIKPFVSAATVNTTYGRSSTHLWASRRSGRNNGTLYFWDGLIEDFRFPFLKTILPRLNKPWQVPMAHLRDVIEQHTRYPYRLIQSNVDRLGCGAPSLPTSVNTPPAGGTF
jgi:lipopolysaccharide biosynthesis protein